MNQMLIKLQTIPEFMKLCIFKIPDSQSQKISNFEYQIFTYNLSQPINSNVKIEHDAYISEINDFDIKFPELIICKIKKVQSSNFYLFHFDDKLLIVNTIHFAQLNKFLKNITSKTSLFFFSNKQKDIFLDEISSFGINIQSNINVFDDLFKYDIKNTVRCNFFEISKNKQFWIFIHKVVVGYIIERGHILTRLARMQRKTKLEFNLNYSNYNKKEFLQINNKSRTKIKYNIKEQRMCVFKILSENQREKECYDLIDCHHPFISNKIGEVEEDSKKYIVLEYIEGKDLKNSNELKLKYFEKIKIIGEIMLAIEFIHSKNIIIRDIKSDNIKIDSMNDAILIDFDNSKKIGSDNFTGNIGSLAFAAPEQNGGNEYTYKVDIYSLGIVIYLIIMGNMPKEKSKKIFDTIPKNFLFLKEIFQDCIDYSPEMRPNISTLVNDYLFKLQDSLANGIINENQKEIREIIKCLNSIRFQFLKQIKTNEQLSIINLSDIYYYFGINLIEGKFMQQNINESIKCLKYSSKLNNRNANHSLGIIYFNGKCIAQNLEQSIYYLTLAADQNRKESQFMLSNIYMSLNNIKEAIHYLTLAADQNFVHAQQLLATVLFTRKQYRKAIHYYTLAANQGNSESQCMLGYLYIEGMSRFSQIIHDLHLTSYQNQINIPFAFDAPDNLKENYFSIDIEKGIYYFTQAAEQNNNEAKFELGIIYNEGRLVPRDIGKAIKYFAQYHGDRQSQAYFNLGLIYIDETNPKYDIKESIHYFELSSKLNNSEAQYNLGVIYYNIKPFFNINKAIYYFDLASQSNHSNAQYNLGIIYSEGIYVRDIYKAIDYLKKSASQNNQLSQTLLGIIYYNEKYKVQNIEKAIHYLTLAANQGNDEAQFHLGNIYYIKKYKKYDIKKSIEYYSESAIRGNSRAQFNLSIIYKNEYGDINKALFYLTKSANGNFTKAQFCLGFTYFDESNTIFNFRKAFYYLGLAAKQNHSEALFVLGSIYSEGEYVPKNIVNAIKCYIDSSNLNNVQAKNNRGVIYKNGDGVPRNISLAIELFEEAKDCFSLFNLAKIYYFAIDVRKDVSKALNYLLIASENFFLFADVFLFFIYSCDETVGNEAEANKYLKKINEKMSNRFVYNLNDSDASDGLYFIELKDLIYNPNDKYQRDYMSFFFGINFLNRKKQNDSNSNYSNQKEINDLFYQGFGLII